MPYDPNCRTDTRVYVNETRLPVGDVDLHIRKREGDGLNVNRYAEITFASPWEGEDYAQYFQGLDDEQQERYDTLRIEGVPDYQRETTPYETIFHGMVTAVGNGPGPEREWHARAQGPGLFMSRIAANQAFDDATVRGSLRYVAARVADRLPLTIPVDAGTAELQDSFLQTLADNGIVAALTGNDGKDEDNWIENALTDKTFQRNRHTLSNVLQWVADKSGARLWFEPYEDGAVLVGTDTPTSQSHKAHYIDGGDIQIVNNDALVELNPVNTITVKGKAARSLAELGDFEVNVPANRYFSATARHLPLYQRANETEYLAEPDQPTDAESKTEVENEAKSMLKRQIDKTTSGDMLARFSPQLKPYDVLTAKPTCEASQATNVKAIDYEVNRVHHKVRGDGLSKTKLVVGVHAALEDIEIVDSWKTSTKT